MAVSYAPKPKKKPKSEATVHVGNILRNAAKASSQPSQPSRGFDLRGGVTPQNFLRPTIPLAPKFPAPPTIQPTDIYLPDARLAAALGGPNETVDPLKMQFESATARALNPSQAHFARVNASGNAAKAQEFLNALYPQGVQPTEFQPLELSSLDPRQSPEFPNRPAPREDLMGSLLAGIAGIIDKPGAGAYNAAPLQAGMNVAQQDYGDAQDRFRYAVQIANQQFEDRAAERGEQFKAAIYNQGRQDNLRGENRKMAEQYAGLRGDVAGAKAEVSGYGPLVQNAQLAQHGAAVGDVLSDYLGNSLRQAQIGNDAKTSQYKLNTDWLQQGYENDLRRAQMMEQQRNNEFDVFGATMRALAEQARFPLWKRETEADIALKNAQARKYASGQGEGDSPLRMFELATRIAGMGGDPTQMLPGMPQNPAWGNLGQFVGGMKAGALHLRHPGIRNAQKAVDMAVAHRNALVQSYQPLISKGEIDGDGMKSYIGMLGKANNDIINANAKLQEEIEKLPKFPTTPGATVLPGKSRPNRALPPLSPAPPASSTRTPSSPAMKTSASVSGGKVVRQAAPPPAPAKKVPRVYDPATGQFK
jgi:hypothetical protein